jgi:hypothetical protein
VSPLRVELNNSTKHAMPPPALGAKYFPTPEAIFTASVVV